MVVIFSIIVSLFLHVVTGRFWISCISTGALLVIFSTFLLSSHIDTIFVMEYLWVVAKYGSIGFIVAVIVGLIVNKTRGDSLDKPDDQKQEQ